MFDSAGTVGESVEFVGVVGDIVVSLKKVGAKVNGDAEGTVAFSPAVRLVGGNVVRLNALGDVVVSLTEVGAKVKGDAEGIVVFSIVRFLGDVVVRLNALGIKVVKGTCVGSMVLLPAGDIVGIVGISVRDGGSDIVGLRVGLLLVIMAPLKYPFPLPLYDGCWYILCLEECLSDIFFLDEDFCMLPMPLYPPIPL